MSQRALVFGATGAIGSAVADRLGGTFDVVRASRAGGDGTVAVDPFGDAGLGALAGHGPYDAVVWAQGANANDSIADVDLDVHEGLLRANVVFVTATMSHLLREDLVPDGARFVVLSSIWQEVARQQKLSYTVSKAALAGLVRSAAVDLGTRGILVNAVLPGVTDTPMTRSMLSDEQIAGFAGATGFDRLPSLPDVCGAVEWLSSPSNTGVTGQFIAVDLGFTFARLA